MGIGETGEVSNKVGSASMPVRPIRVVGATIAHDPGAVKSRGQKKTGPDGPVDTNQNEIKTSVAKKITSRGPARP